MLKTEWKYWDKFLNHLNNKEIHILELGVYKGEAMKWFIDNLMTNKKTTYIGVDTFGGSPEFFIYDKSNSSKFDPIKAECFDKIEKSGKKNQINIMIKTTKEALYELYKIENKENYFDIIFIDASHEAIDVLSDCILSWNVLKEGGILINDDYYWDMLNQEYFRPKISIDSFINIYKSQCEVLHVGRQVILRKKIKSEFELPRENPAIRIQREISEQNPENFILKLPSKKKEELLFELTFMDEPDYVDKNIIKKLNKLKENPLDKSILQNTYFCKVFNKNAINYFYNFYKNLINRNDFNAIKNFYIVHEKKIIFQLINILNFIDSRNINFSTINYLTVSYKYFTKPEKNNKHDFLKKQLLIFLNKKNKKIKDLKFKLIYPKNEYKTNNVIKNNNIIHMNYNIYESYNIKKINFVQISFPEKILFTNNIFDSNDILYEYIYNAFFNIILGITYQTKGGIACIELLDISMDISIHMLEIIRNYYEDVQIIVSENDSKLRKNTIYYIVAEKFRGILKKELKILHKILNNIKNKKLFFNIFPKNSLNKEYINIIYKFNNNYNNYLLNYLKFINKIYDKLNDHTDNFNITNIKKTLLKSQLNYLLLYLGKNKILDII